MQLESFLGGGTAGRGGGGDLNAKRGEGHATLPLEISMITNLTVLVVSLKVSMLQ